jgi:hypothetical protein
MDWLLFERICKRAMLLTIDNRSHITGTFTFLVGKYSFGGGETSHNLFVPRIVSKHEKAGSVRIVLWKD